MDEEKIIEEKKEEIIDQRKEKITGFLKNRWIWTSAFLIIALILGIYIRSLPMQDHNTSVPGNQPGLWNYATNDWTLGPDLDPWLFLRIAKEIVKTGSISKIDYMRYVPLGFPNDIETRLLPYMIAWTYDIIKVFGYDNVTLAGVIFPVIMFAFTIIAFFLFVREIFNYKDKDNKTQANIIALVATFFMIVIPVFLSRTVAGIPEKESAGFFFMFLAFYFFIKSWKEEKYTLSILFTILAGFSTGLMSLIWGGVVYVYVTIAVSTFIAFVFDKVNRKQLISLTLFTAIAYFMFLFFSARGTFSGLITSVNSGILGLVLFIIIIHFIIWDTRVRNLKILSKIKIPRNIFSIIFSVVLILVLVSVMFGPGFILAKFSEIQKTLFTPTTGRWIITVAENRQPYYSEWGSDFGPYIAQLPNIPIMFWMFFAGSVVLLLMTLKEKIKKRDAWILTILFALFFIGLVFSRYAPHPNVFDGEGIESSILYLGTALLFVAGIIYFYAKYEKRGDKGFEEIDYSIILLFVLYILCLFTSRSAIRLVMVLGPIATIFVAYLIVKSIYSFIKAKDETLKIIIGAVMVLVIILGVFTFYNFYQSVTSQAYSFVPSSYNYQWQNAMKWVDENTTKDSVFVHWWDYGYWVQSLGNRATVTDGGNAQVFWNYLSGRFVLTGDNQNDSLDFCYAHNVSYLLIDSSDIGKYGAFSSIGSDANYDRYSWIGTFVMNDKQTQETKNQTLLVYEGGIALDEDLAIDEGGNQVILPAGSTGVGLVVLPVETVNGSQRYAQPYVVMQYNGVVHKINMRYLSVEGQFLDFKSGIEACAFTFPSLASDGQRVSENKIGAIMFLSPRLLRGYLAQKYILDDPFKKFPNFVIAHNEPSLIVQNLRSQGMQLPDFVYFNGVQGPIKIWKIKYTGKETIRQEFIDTDPTKYLTWSLS